MIYLTMILAFMFNLQFADIPAAKLQAHQYCYNVSQAKHYGECSSYGKCTSSGEGQGNGGIEISNARLYQSCRSSGEGQGNGGIEISEMKYDSRLMPKVIKDIRDQRE